MKGCTHFGGSFCGRKILFPHLRKKKLMRKSLFTVGAFVMVMVCSSWGYLVHRTVNQLAIYELPSSIRPFFYQNKEYLVKHSVRPDERRNTDTTEASKHFIDLEIFGDSAAWKLPQTWQELVQRFPKDTILKYGYGPYVIMDVKEALTRAFRTRNRDSILFYAADLGHYIGDLHVPLHTSLNYDGQLTGQKGLHSLWESTIPQLNISKYNLSSKHKARYLPAPAEEVWAAVRRSFTLTRAVFHMEAEVTKSFTSERKYRVQERRGKEVRSYTTEFARAYAGRLGNMVNDQLIASADLTADFWYTCWVDGGKPSLSAIAAQPMTKADKKALSSEVKLFKKNGLLTQNKLIAQTRAEGAE